METDLARVVGGLQNSVGGEKQWKWKGRGKRMPQWPVRILRGDWATRGARYKHGFIWFKKKYISASDSSSPDCNGLNECGARDASGRRRNVRFLVCVIRTLGSWVSFNCHPELRSLPENEESYWFPSGHTIYFLVLINLICIFILCHSCVQASAAFTRRFQVGLQLNMWPELQGVSYKNCLIYCTVSAQCAVRLGESPHL